MWSAVNIVSLLGDFAQFAYFASNLRRARQVDLRTVKSKILRQATSDSYTPSRRHRAKKMPPPTKRRRTEPTVVEEITFDPSARQEYLTGFHKRKVQRAKHAQAAAERTMREERLVGRRKVEICYSQHV